MKHTINPSRQMLGAAMHDVFVGHKQLSGKRSDRSDRNVFSYPNNLLAGILRMRSLNCDLEALGHPHFLVQLYRKALHSRCLME